jgi:hypothetical protein
MAATGPLFDGRAQAALRDYEEWAQREVAQQAMADWHLNMERSFREPTGRYESTVHLTEDEYGAIVHDQGMIYNYWLEGYGSRNFPVTAFAGYFSAERAADELRPRAAGLVNPIPARFLSQMGGAP